MHANSAVDALHKIVGYCVLAGQNVLVDYVQSSLASVADLVVHLKRTPAGRFVQEIAEVAGVSGGTFEVDYVYRRPAESL